MFTLQFKPWAFIASITILVAVSCTGGGQGGSGFDDCPTGSVPILSHTQESEWDHIQDMEMMAAAIPDKP